MGNRYIHSTIFTSHLMKTADYHSNEEEFKEMRYNRCFIEDII